MFNLFKKNKYKDKLSNVDFMLAKELIINKFSGGVYPEDLVSLLNNFIQNPCASNAIELIKYDNDFISIFILCEKGSIFHRNKV